MTLATLQFDARYIDLILTEDILQDEVVIQGNIIGVALTSGVKGEKISLDQGGIKRLPAITSSALDVGDELYWDADLKHVTSTTTSNTIIIGTCVSDKGFSDDKVDVKLHSFLVSGVSVSPGSVTASSTTEFNNKSIDANTPDTGNIITNIGASEVESGIISDQITASVAVTDSIIFSDASDSNALKKDTVQNLVNLANSAGTFDLINDSSPQLGGDLDLNDHLLFKDGSTDSTDDNILIEFANVNLDKARLKISNATISGDVLLEVIGSDSARLVLASGDDTHVTIGDKTNNTFIEFNLAGALGNTTTTFSASQQANQTISLPDKSGTLALTSDLGSSDLVNDTSPQLGGNLDLFGTRLFIDSKGASGLNQVLEFRNINNDASHLAIGNAISGGDVFLQAKGATDSNLVLTGGASGHVAIIDNVDEKRLEFHLDQATANTTTILDAKQTANRTIILPDSDGTLALKSELTSSDLVNDTSPQLGGTLDTNNKQIRWSRGADVLSANILSLTTDGNVFDITGILTVTKIISLAIGTVVVLHFTNTLTLTNSTLLILPSGSNITTASGDVFTFVQVSSIAWRCIGYTLASGEPIVGGAVVDDTIPQLGGNLDLNGNLFFNDNTGPNSTNGRNILIQFANVDNDQARLKISNATLTGDVILEVEGSDTARLVLASGSDTNVTLGDVENNKFIDFDFSSALDNTTTTIKSNQQEDRTLVLPREGGTLALTSDISSSGLVDDTTPQLGGILDANSHQIRWSRGAEIDSATTLPLGTDGNTFSVAGSTNITKLGPLADGTVVVLHFTGTLIITNSTSLILPSGADITTSTGDIFTFVQVSPIAWRCIGYSLASGKSIIGGNVVDDITPQLGGTLDTNSKQIRWSKGIDVASALSMILGTDGNVFDITGTTTIANMNLFTIGTVVVLNFTDILTLTHNSSSFILPGGADITTAAGDVFTFVQRSNIGWRCIGYTLASGRSVVGSTNIGASQIAPDIINSQSPITTLADADTILVYDDSTSVLGKATAKQIADLNSGGTGIIEQIRDVDFTAQSTVELLGIFSSTYTEYHIRLEFVCNQASTTVLFDWTFNIAGIAWFKFTKGLISLVASNTTNNFNTETGNIIINSSQGTLCTFEFKLFNPSALKDHSIIGQSAFRDSDSATEVSMNLVNSWFLIESDVGNAINGLRFRSSIGTITGNYTILAVKA